MLALLPCTAATAAAVTADQFLLFLCYQRLGDVYLRLLNVNCYFRVSCNCDQARCVSEAWQAEMLLGGDGFTGSTTNSRSAADVSTNHGNGAL
jgi:hypothetical protein